MTPKKNRGFRRIVINNIVYYWRFSGLIEIRPDKNQSNKLEVNFGYLDSWLYINDKSKPDTYEPKIVTPGFIKESVENALKSGWNIESKNQTKMLNFTDGNFEVVDQ